MLCIFVSNFESGSKPDKSHTNKENLSATSHISANLSVNTQTIECFILHTYPIV